MAAVSVLIRTIGRLPALKEALASLSQQTFKDFEVVVVEDGPATLEAFLSPYSSPFRGEAERGAVMETALSTIPHPNPPSEGEGIQMFPLRYEALGIRKGRSAAGNRALTLAQGQYCLFLDEDDLLYPNHLQSLVDAARAGGKAIAYSWSEERSVDRAENGTIVNRGRLKRYRRERFSLLHLIAGNYLPINAVLFQRTLFDRAGGFDEDIDCLEDWLLWLRFASLEPEWLCVPCISAVYHAPLDKRARRKAFKAWHTKVHERMQSIILACPVQTLHRDLKRHFFVAIFIRKLYYYFTGYIGSL